MVVVVIMVISYYSGSFGIVIVVVEVASRS